MTSNDDLAKRQHSRQTKLKKTKKKYSSNIAVVIGLT